MKRLPIKVGLIIVLLFTIISSFLFVVVIKTHFGGQAIVIPLMLAWAAITTTILIQFFKRCVDI